jgi:hypothetical protein
VSFKAGIFLMKTAGDPGTQGEAVAGIHGAGVGTPRAAEVAAATTGFDGVVHIPNGIIFFMGT